MVDGRIAETAAAPVRPVRTGLAVGALPQGMRQQSGLGSLVGRYPGTAGRVEDGREPGVDGEILAAVQPRTLAERQRQEVVRVVNDAEPLVSPAHLVSRSLFQIKYGNLAVVKVRANPVDERIGLRAHILTRSQVLIQTTEPELERFDSRPVRHEHSVKVGIPVPDSNDRRPAVL